MTYARLMRGTGAGAQGTGAGQRVSLGEGAACKRAAACTARGSEGQRVACVQGAYRGAPNVLSNIALSPSLRLLFLVLFHWSGIRKSFHVRCRLAGGCSESAVSWNMLLLGYC